MRRALWLGFASSLALPAWGAPDPVAVEAAKAGPGNASTPAAAIAPGASSSAPALAVSSSLSVPPGPGAGPSGGPGSTPDTYEFQPGVLCPFCAITPQYPYAESGLHWHHHWRRVAIPEYVVTGVFGAIALGVELGVKPEERADWNTPILFDGAVRDALRVDSASGRDTAKDLSDVLFLFSVAHPVLDNFMFAWWLRESPQVAWQMFVINAQAYSLTLALNVVTKRLTGRARPWAENCSDDPTSDPRCPSGDGFRSFYSGHAAVTATGAGLVCAHHTQLSLYQNDYLDAGACGVAVLGTALTGGLRIASDNHWASDVIIGHLMGYLAGYLYPTLMFYREFRLTPESPQEHQGPTFAVLPWVTPGGVQLSMFGMF